MELLKIRTEQFEGPLDLMLFLIQKNELDINTVSIHKITDQYVQYCHVIKEINFDLCADFLLMAATLIHLKSKRLLPNDELTTGSGTPGDEVGLSEEELVRRLKEYKKYQQMGDVLEALPKLNSEIFTRPNVPAPEKQSIWKEMDLTSLTLVFQDTLRRQRKRTKIIIREPTSIPERITQLGKILQVGVMTEFEKIIPVDADKSFIVVTFIALLEIVRLKKLKVYQTQVFGTIFMTLTESLDEFDLSLATGFQYKAMLKQQENTPHAS